VLHQLAVTGKQAADVAVLIFGQELQIHRIERLIQLERHFWQLVQSQEQPPADGSESANTALRALYPHDSGQTLDLCQDEAMAAVFAHLLAVRELITVNTEREQQLKQRIQRRMGEATRALFPIGEVSWKRARDGSSIDLDQLLKDLPELAPLYSRTKPGSRRFVIHT